MLSADRTIIQFSDTHILPAEGELLHGVTDTMQNLRDAIELVANGDLRPDAFLISGDLTDRGEIEAYRRLRAMVDEIEERFGVPVLLTMGNHDDRANLRQGLLQQDATLESYDYVRWIGGLRMIVLDSTIPGSHAGEIDAQQLDWLRAELETPAPEGTLVVVHHPPVPGPVPLLNTLILRNRQQFGAALEGTDVVGILCGHVHHPISSSLNGIPVAAVTATAYNLDPLVHDGRFRGIEGPGFGIVQLFGRQMVVTSVALPATQREVYEHRIDPERWAAMTGAGVAAPAGA